MRIWIGRFLGICFVLYGAIKLAGGQFNHEPFVIDSRSTDGTYLVWSFFGYSDLYGRLIGVAEMVPGLLLLFPRTLTLGAMLLFPITLNITLMDFCFHFPSVKYLSLLFTLLCGGLIASDGGRLKQLVAPAVEAVPSLERKSAFLRTARSLLGLLAILFLTNLVWQAMGPDPTGAALTRIAGTGWQRPTVKRWAITSDWLGFNRRGYVEIKAENADGPRLIRIEIRRLFGLADWQTSEPQVVYHR